MRRRAWTTRGALMVAGVCGTALLTACGGMQPGSGDTESSTPPATSAPSSTTTPDETTTSAAPLDVPEGAAQNLCDMMEPELSNWRVQGPTLGRAGLNLMVHEWGLTNGVGNTDILADKGVADRVTEQTCPDVRTQALQALEIPDLAAGLAF